MATAEDAEGILRVHYDAVHKFAARSYPPEILDEWSSVVDERRIAATSRNISENPDDEICLVAELHGISTGKVEKTAEKEAEKTAQNKIIGFASVVPKNNELRAVYVSPELVGEDLELKFSRLWSALPARLESGS